MKPQRKLSGVPVVMLTALLFFAPISFSQILGFFPPADSIGISGSCVPPTLICELRSVPTGVDTIVIRSPHDLMYVGRPIPGSPLIDRCYFTVLNGTGGNHYSLRFMHRSPYYRDTVLVPFDSLFYVIPGPFTISLFVYNAQSVIDSATARFHSAQTGLSVDEQASNGKPTSFVLEQNYPNPFNPSTEIRYQIPVEDPTRREVSHVTLKVFDLLGREMATLVNEVKQSGTHTVTWDASGFSSSVYFYRLIVGDFVETKRLVVVR